MATIAQRECLRAVTEMLGLVPPGARIGIACSGGADSVALADAAISAAGASRLYVVTVDHGLFPASAHVAQSVSAWAAQRGAHGVIRRVEVVRRASLEAAARDARYEALGAVVREFDLTALWLGHTARDQAETVLMRILRGTGPAGVAGIPRVRGPFARPFLSLSRATTEEYVSDRGLPTWHDPMNADHALQRIRLREVVLPFLRSENPAVDDALIRLAASAREWMAVIDSAADRFARWPIDCGALAEQPAAVRKRSLAIALDHQGMSFDAVHLEKLDALVTAPVRGEVAIDIPGARLVRRYNELRIATPGPLEEAVRDRRHGIAPGHELRTWRPGDRMRPARLRGRSRKLSDLFIDAKVPRDARRTAQVLVRTADGVIVWAEHVGLAFGESPEVAPL